MGFTKNKKFNLEICKNSKLKFNKNGKAILNKKDRIKNNIQIALYNALFLLGIITICSLSHKMIGNSAVDSKVVILAIIGIVLSILLTIYGLVALLHKQYKIDIAIFAHSIPQKINELKISIEFYTQLLKDIEQKIFKKHYSDYLKEINSTETGDCYNREDRIFLESLKKENTAINDLKINNIRDKIRIESQQKNQGNEINKENIEALDKELFDHFYDMYLHDTLKDSTKEKFIKRIKPILEEKKNSLKKLIAKENSITANYLPSPHDKENSITANYLPSPHDFVIDVFKALFNSSSNKASSTINHI